MEEWITSVGIDLGTSTTKWLLSRLKLTRTSGGFALPKYEITERVVEYASPIYPTPLLGDDRIDVPSVVSLLDKEYARAGLLPAQVQTGAVIITGETATKRNAEELAHGLARHAGQFVAAAAGADLESLLAGKGSGAQRYSLDRDEVIANVDIGGGTANTAYFRRGRMIATATFHIGGRLVRLEESGRIIYTAAPLRAWLDGQAAATMPEAGSTASLPELRMLCAAMADTLLRCVSGEPAALREAQPLLVGAPAVPLPAPGEIWISGGVGALIGETPPRSMAETARHGDIGPLLAAELAARARSFPVPVRAAEHPARATVIGAGTRTTEVSGATMYYSPGLLPLRNIPAAVCELPPEAADAGEDARRLREAVAEAVQRALSVYSQAGGDPPFALCLRSGGICSYRRLQRIVDALLPSFEADGLREKIMLLVCESDMAKSLAYMLLGRLPEPRRSRLVCLDQLSPSDGDYLDVGEPIKEDVVPVVIKSLVFGE